MFISIKRFFIPAIATGLSILSIPNALHLKPYQKF
jgi:hypothetical protein